MRRTTILNAKQVKRTSFSEVRTPLCKISSTGEIEQRFRLN